MHCECETCSLCMPHLKLLIIINNNNYNNNYNNINNDIFKKGDRVHIHTHSFHYSSHS